TRRGDGPQLRVGQSPLHCAGHRRVARAGTDQPALRGLANPGAHAGQSALHAGDRRRVEARTGRGDAVHAGRQACGRGVRERAMITHTATAGTVAAIVDPARALARQKAWVTGLVALCGFVYVAAKAVESRHPAIAYVAAFAE